MPIAARLSAVALAALLSACGGGESSVTAVKVAGDSLADGGTFGFKFTVQGTSLNATRIWVDYVADAVGVGSLCPRNRATSPDGSTVALNPNATSCTNHAVGGARINVSGTAGDATPFSILQQLRNLGQQSYTATDVLLVDGGGNDAADLLTAFLAARTDGGASYVALLQELLPAADVQAAAAAGSQGLAQAGGQYMMALADALVNTLTTEALNKGARRVVVLTVPDITRTPRFQVLLAAIRQSQGEAAATQVATVANAWVQAFNLRLSQRFAGDARVALVDFYAALNAWLANPAQFGLTNTSTPVCPATGADSQGFPTYSIHLCTEAVAAANVGPNWNTYVFSDNFHGTPRTNQLMGQAVVEAMRARGWL